MLAVLTSTMIVAQNYQTSPDVITACKGYIEIDGQPSNYALNSTQLTEWPVNSNSACVQYIHFPAGYVKAELSGRGGGFLSTCKLALKITDASNGAVIHDGTVSLTYNINEKNISAFNGVYFPTEGWYRFELKKISGTLGSFSNWRFYKESSSPIYFANNFSSPSVHIWHSTMAPGAPTGDAYNWLYHEIMIPQGHDYQYTYAMAIGQSRLYMGIQANGANRHDVIFSVWDNGDTDIDPNLSEYLKSGAIDSGEGVTIERFGNEGTGTKAFKMGEHWTPGEFVQFICNARPATQTITQSDGTTTEYNSMLMTAWYKRERDTEWNYLATHCCSGSEALFAQSEFYSFLENYGSANGQVQRKAYYRNAYAHAAENKKWYHLNVGGYSNTDGGNNIGARNDFGHGIATEYDRCFYMTTGGYGQTVTGNTTLNLHEDNNIVENIDLNALEARIREAIRKQNTLKSLNTLSGHPMIETTGWRVIAWSDEETSGEGTNGRATQILDGNEDTYWHSQWYSQQPTFPHSVTIEAPDTYELNALELCTKRHSYSGTTYNPSKMTIEVSNDGNSWETAISDISLPLQEYPNIVLPEPAIGKYFRLTFNEGYGTYLFINEIYLFGEIPDAPNVPNEDGLYPVESFDELSNDKAYIIKNANSLGSIIYSPIHSNSNIWICEAERTASGNGTIYSNSYKADIDYNDINHHWYILQIDGKMYLCNAGNKKSIGTGFPCTFKSTYTPIYVSCVNKKFTFNTTNDGANYMCASPQLETPVNVWTSDDEGSKWLIYENPAMEANSAEVIDAIMGRTAIEDITTEEYDDTIYDLQGRKIEKITKAGIYIINGKKVIKR